MKKILLFTLLLIMGQVYSQNLTLAELVTIRTAPHGDTKKLLKEKGWVDFFAYAKDDDVKFPVRTFALADKDKQPSAYMDVNITGNRGLDLQIFNPVRARELLKEVQNLKGVTVYNQPEPNFYMYTDDRLGYVFAFFTETNKRGIPIENWYFSIMQKDLVKLVAEQRAANKTNPK